MHYRFGQFQLDAARYELTRAGKRVTVRPKVFDILRYLVERPGRLVTKQELLVALWAGQQVSDSSVPWTIGHARRAIGQRSGEQTPIETVHGRGYRFHGAVDTLEGKELEAPVVLEPSDAPPPFVGREALTGALDERLRTVAAGRGGVCLLLGDAGIGKTRCLDELATRARAQGFAVWAGRSAVQAALAPVYFPWLQLLAAAQADAPVPTELAALLAGLSSVGCEAAGETDRDALLGRLSLFETTHRFLVDSGRKKPVLVLLDDLHWADAATLELLAFIAPELRNARVLVVAAARELSGVAAAHVTAELMRHAERFDLSPLSMDDVARYLQRLSADHGIPPALSAAVHRASAGYPLFVQETLRTLLSRHGRAQLSALSPDSVEPSALARDLLIGRFAALDLATQRALGHASVLGESFEVADLARLSANESDTLLPALDAALRAGFVVTAGAHAFGFRHALFRELVYAQLSSAERSRDHRAVALLRQSAADSGLRKSEIAYHYYHSLGLGQPEEVCAAALEAANAARSAHAFADAAQFYTWALEALALAPHASPRQYAELLLQRAQSERCFGNTSGAQATIEQLVALAALHGYADLLVAAARALRLSHAMGGLPDPLARTALERALVLLPESPNSLRIQAMSLLAWLPPDSRDAARTKASSQRALELARALADPEALAEALVSRLYALSGPDDIDALLAVSAEMLLLDADRRGWISVEAYTARHEGLLQRGDLIGADAAMQAIGEIARSRGFLELNWHYDRHCAQRRFLLGEFAVAQAEFARLTQAGKRMRVQGGDMLSHVHYALAAVATAGPRAFAAAGSPGFFRMQLPATRSYPNLHAQLGRLALAFDQFEAAHTVLAEWSTDAFRVVPKDLDYLHTLCTLAQVAIGLGDRPRARQLYALLAPYAQHNTPNILGLYEGPVAHFLGLLAEFLDEDEHAERHFADAVDLCERLGLRPFLARTCLVYARWLFKHDMDSAQGLVLQARARNLSEHLGMHWLAQQASALAASSGLA